MSKSIEVKEQENNSVKGQSFLEFILLLMVILSMSIVMVKGINGSAGDRWVALVKKIAGPTTSPIELR
jgi:hypothetical protein